MKWKELKGRKAIIRGIEYEVVVNEGRNSDRYFVAPTHPNTMHHAIMRNRFAGDWRKVEVSDICEAGAILKPFFTGAK